MKKLEVIVGITIGLFAILSTMVSGQSLIGGGNSLTMPIYPGVAGGAGYDPLLYNSYAANEQLFGLSNSITDLKQTVIIGFVGLALYLYFLTNSSVGAVPTGSIPPIVG
ncbi:uncharacterized protein LOC134228722 [Saccostrea cucullata]|uniref:uncharacterized protein LOC134228722 n=1 Tax=Saccostrea cuccullata TaxID=36930 RepID=UPI002ED2627E